MSVQELTQCKVFSSSLTWHVIDYSGLEMVS